MTLRSGPRLWEIQAVRDFGVALLLLVAVGIAYWLSVIFTPVLLAFLAAYLIDPWIEAAAKRGIKREVTTSLLLVCIVLTGLGVAFWLGPIMQKQAGRLHAELPAYAAAMSQRASAKLLAFGIDVSLDDLLRASTNGRVMTMVQGMAAALAHIGLALIFFPVCFYGFATQGKKTLTEILQRMSSAGQARLTEVLDVMDRAFSGFVRGRLLVMLICIPLFSLAWKLTDVPYWFLLGSLAAFLNIVPFMAFFALIAAILANYAETLLSGAAFELQDLVIMPTAAYAVVQAIEGWILTPLVQSKKTDLSPALILVAVATGAALGGVVGMLLAIPVASSAKMLLKFRDQPGSGGSIDERDFNPSK